MTTDQSSGTMNEEARRPRTWGDIAATFAWQMGRPDFKRGDLAELRRMDPDSPDAAAFWRLMAQEDLLGGGPNLERKWALILHGIALMTPTAGGNGNSRSAHDGAVPVGRAMFSGGDSGGRASGYYSETRLNRLLTARGPILRTLLGRMFRMLAAANASFNWREMASFILDDGFREDRAELHRYRIAREYYMAERRSTQTDSQSD